MSEKRQAVIGNNVLTPHGLVGLDKLKEGDKIWTSSGWATITRYEVSNSIPIHTYETGAGVLRLPKTTMVLSDENHVAIHSTKKIDRMMGPKPTFNTERLDPRDVIDGLVFGDGSYDKEYKKLWLCIGKQDMDYLESEVKDYIGKPAKELNRAAYLVKTRLTPEEVPYTWERGIPSRYQANPKKIAGFLRGLYTANGCVNGKRVSFKTTSKNLALQIVELLASLNIPAYYTENKPTSVKWDNGTYTSKKSYDVYTSAVVDFANCIGFLQKYKQEKLQKLVDDFNPDKNFAKGSYEVSIERQAKIQSSVKLATDSKDGVYWMSGFAVCEDR